MNKKYLDLIKQEYHCLGKGEGYPFFMKVVRCFSRATERSLYTLSLLHWLEHKAIADDFLCEFTEHEVMRMFDSD